MPRNSHYQHRPWESFFSEILYGEKWEFANAILSKAMQYSSKFNLVFQQLAKACFDSNSLRNTFWI